MRACKASTDFFRTRLRTGRAKRSSTPMLRIRQPAVGKYPVEVRAQSFGRVGGKGRQGKAQYKYESELQARASLHRSHSTVNWLQVNILLKSTSSVCIIARGLMF